MEAKAKNVQVGLRVPADLAKWLKDQAEENRRSVSSQAAWAIQQFRKQREARETAQ